jgi:hypothetical protein
MCVVDRVHLVTISLGHSPPTTATPLAAERGSTAVRPAERGSPVTGGAQISGDRRDLQLGAGALYVPRCAILHLGSAGLIAPAPRSSCLAFPLSFLVHLMPEAYSIPALSLSLSSSHVTGVVVDRSQSALKRT